MLSRFSSRLARALVRIAIALPAAAGAAAAHGQCEPTIRPGLALPGYPTGLQSEANAMVVWDPDGPLGPQQHKLVAAGTFTQAGTNAASRIAYWDGTNWWPLGQGFNNTVNTLAVVNDQLYAGGSFTLSGATTVNRVARWSAATNAWVAVGQGFNDEVHALTGHAGQLFAGGKFTASGAVTGLTRIAMLNGSTWGPVSGGTDGGYVWALHSHGGRLYVGGQFSAVGGTSVAATNVAWWTPAAGWNRMGGTPQFNGAFGGRVMCFASHNFDLLVGGEFSSVNGTIPSSGVARFVPDATGGAWASGHGSGGSGMAPMEVRGILVDGGYIYIAGSNGTDACRRSTTGQFDTWQNLGSPIVSGGGGRALTRHNNQVVLCGHFQRLGSTLDLGNIAVLNGASWEPPAAGIAGFVTSFTNFGGSLVAGGQFEQLTPTGELCRNLITTNGTTIGSLGTTDGYVTSLLTRGNGFTLPTLIVGGQFTTAGGVAGMNNMAQRTLIEPASWSAMGSGFNAAVFTLTTFGSTGGPAGQPIVYAGGTFTHSGATLVNRVARFVSGAWQPLAGGVTSTSGFCDVYCFGRLGGLLYVGGTFDSAGGVAPNSIGAWNGTAWSALGSGVQNSGSKGTVRAMTQYNGSLYVGGRFTHAGGIATTNIARWDGAAWHAVPAIGGAGDEVRAMALHYGRLYAAVSNPSTSGNGSTVVVWNGTGWSPAVPGTADLYIGAMTSYSGELHVGGQFTRMGGVAARAWVRLECACAADTDGDGVVAPADVASFVTIWLQSLQNGTLDGDFDRNGVVDPADIAAFTNSWFEVVSTGVC